MAFNWNLGVKQRVNNYTLEAPSARETISYSLAPATEIAVKSLSV